MIFHKDYQLKRPWSKTYAFNRNKQYRMFARFVKTASSTFPVSDGV